MAGATLLTLLDDIATVLDDVAAMSQLAAKKTAGVLGDDLALNAQQVTGIRAERELPVIWAVAKGSALNKAILVPAALLIQAFAPSAMSGLLMIGGAYLCFEGAEKILEKLFHSDAPATAAGAPSSLTPDTAPTDLAAYEADKIRGAVRTDFILSAEIIVIALGTVAAATFTTQVLTLALVAAVMTAGVYGLVAAIVKLDDLGLLLQRKASQPWLQALGRGLVQAAAPIMKGLAVAGTVAMFLVGGSIISHGIPMLHELQSLAQPSSGWVVPNWAFDGVVGLVSGVLCTMVVHLGQSLFERIARRAPPQA